MNIFTIGLPKTGTSSLFDFLRIQCGLNCVKGCNVEGRKRWYKDRSGYYNHIDLYDCVKEYYTPMIYKELHEMYPEGKFILTVRNAWDWQKSLQHMMERPSKVEGIDIWRVALFGFSSDEILCMNPSIRNELMERYVKRNKEVVKYFEDIDGELLVVDIDKKNIDKAKMICEFLDLPFEECVYPHSNKTVVEV